MMNKMNMKFHEICAMSERYQVIMKIYMYIKPFFSDGTASNKKKKKKS